MQPNFDPTQTNLDTNQFSIEPPIQPPDKPNQLLNFFQKLSKTQKGSLIAAVFIALAIPLSVTAILSQTRTSSKAAFPVTPPITPPDASPSASPYPSPTPTPPPPSPSPSVNKLPTISTTSLPTGIINRLYKASVVAVDPDAGSAANKLSLAATNLPSGFSLASCISTYTAPSLKTSCTLYGTSKTTGQFSITFTAIDVKGGKTVKTLPFRVIGLTNTDKDLPDLPPQPQLP